jgi:hypothetical protein
VWKKLKGEVMKIWIVVAPQDYASAEIVGVFDSMAGAEKARKNAMSDGRRKDQIVYVEQQRLVSA